MTMTTATGSHTDGRLMPETRNPETRTTNRCPFRSLRPECFNVLSRQPRRWHCRSSISCRPWLSNRVRGHALKLREFVEEAGLALGRESALKLKTLLHPRHRAASDVHLLSFSAEEPHSEREVCRKNGGLHDWNRIRGPS